MGFQGLEIFLGVAGPGLVQRFLVDVGGVDLYPAQEHLLPQRLAEEHRRGIRLLAGGCATAPDSDDAALCSDPGDDLPCHVIPGGRVTEERGDIDEDLVEEDRELVGVNLQVILVRGQARSTAWRCAALSWFSCSRRN